MNRFINKATYLQAASGSRPINEIDVNGETFNNLISPHKHLTNTEMANVISYVKSSFENKLKPITSKKVDKVCKKL